MAVVVVDVWRDHNHFQRIDATFVTSPLTISAPKTEKNRTFADIHYNKNENMYLFYKKNQLRVMKNSLTGGGLAETEDNPQKKNMKITDKINKFAYFLILFLFFGKQSKQELLTQV